MRLVLERQNQGPPQLAISAVIPVLREPSAVRDAPWDRHAELERTDTAVRHAIRPEARLHLARAQALHDLGFNEPARSDFRRAFTLGSADPRILADLITQHVDPSSRKDAAHALVASDRAGVGEIERAVAVLLENGADGVLHARWSGAVLTGWIATAGQSKPQAWAVDEFGGRHNFDLLDPPRRSRHGEHLLWPFNYAFQSPGACVLKAASGLGSVFSLTVPSPEQMGRPSFPPRPSPAGGGCRIAIVVPVFGDPESLEACLASIVRQGKTVSRTVLVDDGSPDIAVSRAAMRFCHGPGRLYIRHQSNRGFAAAVNTGIARCGSHDVLLLNSDVVLPDRALERLRLAAHRSTDIGIVAPLSNDAGNTTFPDPTRPGRPLTSAAAARLDEVAARVNAGVIIDLPSVLGSCLYIRRDCLDAVGPLSLAYGRGYYEDVDLCLRAREEGFRVVAACDVYVSHHSGRSFKSARNPLIARNMAVLAGRFPDQAREDRAHDLADPLWAARAAIEEEAPPQGGSAVLLVGRSASCGALLRFRSRSLRLDGQMPIVLDLTSSFESGDVTVKGETGEGPRSLSFPLHAQGFARLDAYLHRLNVGCIEIVEAQRLPPSLLACLIATKRPITFLADGSSAAAASREIVRNITEGQSTHPSIDVKAIDRFTASHLPRSESSHVPGVVPTTTLAFRRPEPRQHGQAPLRLGVLVPQPAPDVDRLLLALARRVGRTGNVRLIVLGATTGAFDLTAPGSCWISGPMAVDEMPEAAEHHDLQALFLPYRDTHRWALDDVACRRARPQSYFDWSEEGQALDPDDLALDPAWDDETCCSHLLAWPVLSSAV